MILEIIFGVPIPNAFKYLIDKESFSLPGWVISLTRWRNASYYWDNVGESG
jgi:hypothetical protein